MSDNQTVYELTIPKSSPDAVRVGVIEDENKILVEFGFYKNKDLILVDVRKEMDKEMAENLISHLQSALQEIS